jgi:hypothetical protein
MYKSPIDVMIADIQHQIAQQQDEEIYKAVVSVGINVDKDELIRALQYDRRQYDKGYAAGKRDAIADLVRCKDCKHRGEEGCCPMYFVDEIEWDDDGYIEVDYVPHDYTVDDGFCDRGERRTDNG